MELAFAEGVRAGAEMAEEIDLTTTESSIAEQVADLYVEFIEENFHG